MGVVILSSTLLSALCMNYIYGKVGLIVSVGRDVSRTVLLLDAISNNIANAAEKIPVNKRKNEENPARKAVLIHDMMLAVATAGQNPLLAVAGLFIGIAFLLKTEISSNFRDRPALCKIRFYRWWSLRFLTPLQKIHEYLARRYDSNPLKYAGVAVRTVHEKTRTLFTKNGVRVFFIYRKLPLCI